MNILVRIILKAQTTTTFLLGKKKKKKKITHMMSMVSYIRNMKKKKKTLCFVSCYFQYFFSFFHSRFRPLKWITLIKGAPSFVLEIEFLFLFSNNRCLMNSLSSTSLPLCFVGIHPCLPIGWHGRHSVTKPKDVHHLLLIEPFLVDRSLLSPLPTLCRELQLFLTAIEQPDVLLKMLDLWASCAEDNRPVICLFTNHHSIWNSISLSKTANS